MYKILKNIIPSATIIASIIYFIYTFFNTPLDIYEYMILSLLILIATTFLLETLGEKRKWEGLTQNIRSMITEISDCQISIYHNSSDWIDAMDSLLNDGKRHIVDTASLDSTTRSKVKSKHTKIWNHINTLCKNPRIKFRHIVRIRKNNYENLLERIISGSTKQDTYFAYYKLPTEFSFATFGVIDNTYVSTRSPYEDGELPKYIIINNKEIAEYYKSWFESLWQNSVYITDVNCLKNLSKDFYDNFSDSEKDRIENKLKKIEENGITDDI